MRRYALRDGKPDGTQPAREHDGRGYKVPNGATKTCVIVLRNVGGGRFNTASLARGILQELVQSGS